MTTDISVSPFYTTGQNPFLSAFAKKYKHSKGRDAPLFDKDIVAGKNTYVYDAHTYHTKVPPEAITQLLLHYTGEGDLVLDPFCGSGMTGVAALELKRKVILIDLSPAAGFITYNYLTPVNPVIYEDAVQRILESCAEDEQALYSTTCRQCGSTIPIEYMVWSYGAVCPSCGQEFNVWDVARDEKPSVKESRIKAAFSCPYCCASLQKNRLQRTKLYPIEVGYKCCGSMQKEVRAAPNAEDLSRLGQIEQNGIPEALWYPSDRLPEGVNTRQAMNHGMDSIDKLYTIRAVWAVARLWDLAKRWPEHDVRMKLLFTVTSLYKRVTKLSEFRFWGGSSNTANYNVPMIMNEQNVFKVFRRKAKTIVNYLRSAADVNRREFCISIQSATSLVQIPDNCIDYIFTDPPFGGNINYSEMNFLWEAWLQCFTYNAEEVVINRVQRKSLEEYQALMTKALGEMYRVLKPNRWMSMAFHNSSAKVWDALYRSIIDSGFVLIGTQILDRKHATLKQLVSDNAVGYDVVLHCKKYAVDRRKTVRSSTNGVESVKSFIKQAIKDQPEDYVVKYLHVKREKEIDYRKLYSRWLCERISKNQVIDVNFEIFRNEARELFQANVGLKARLLPEQVD